MAYPNSLSQAEVIAFPDRRSWLGEATKFYYDACQHYGVDTKFAGILASQTIWESGVPTQPSNVFRNDNNMGGLKYNSKCPGASPGSPYPSSEGNGVYSRFATPLDYINAHVWTVATYYKDQLSGDFNTAVDSLIHKWVGTSSYYQEKNFVLDCYNKWNLGSCTGDGSWQPSGSAGDSGSSGGGTTSVTTTFSTKPRVLEAANIVEGEGEESWKTFYRFNMTSPAFISQCLTPYARSSATGQAGYRLWFKDSSPVEGKNTTVYFKPDSYINVADRSLLEGLDKHYEFEWGTGVNSSVKSFNPNFAGIVAAVSGGGEVEASVLEALKNEIITTTYNKMTDEERPSTGDTVEEGEEDTGLTIISDSSHSLDELENIAASMWYNMRSIGYTAELVVLGDPELQVQSIVSVLVLNKNGLPHHSSGVYLVTRIVDDITAGTFETTLSLTRNAIDMAANESGGIDITLGSSTTYIGEAAASLGGDGTSSGGSSSGGGGGVASDASVENAVQWAINIANDPSHGYDWSERMGPGDYDCSGLVISAFEQAGFPVKSHGASYTGDMRQAFCACGFKWNAGAGNSLDGLQRGDILLSESSHVEIYIGDGQMVGAHINEKGGCYGGQKGDQTGNEISVGPWKARPWDGTLRYGG